MKFSTTITVMLVIGVIFFMFNMMLLEGESKFPGSGVNNSAWSEKYDYSGEINSSVSPLYQKFNDITNPDLGFFSKIASGLTAIPYAVVLLPGVIFKTVSLGGSITTSMLLALAIPGYVILTVIIGILVWALLKLVEFWGRWTV